ncbi:hypothetical protein ACO0QE_003878 [Hanseniaspora vineae]
MPNHYAVMSMEIFSHEQACQEYGVEFLQHLLALDKKYDLQVKHTSANYGSPAAMVYSSQSIENVMFLNYYSLRKLIFDFMMCCHTKLRLSTPTLILSFQILDKYVTLLRLEQEMLLDRLRFQMIGVVSLWIASKFMDPKIKHPDINILLQLISYNSGKCSVATRADKAQEKMKLETAGKLKNLELDILKHLNWCVSDIPTHDFFVDILLRSIDTFDDSQQQRFENETHSCFSMEDINQIKYGAQMLCELACFYPHINNNHSVSSIAYSSVTLIQKCMQDFYSCGEKEKAGANISLDGISFRLLEMFRDCHSALNEDGFFALPFSFKLKYFPKNACHNPLFLQSLLNFVSKQYCSESDASSLDSGVSEKQDTCASVGATPSAAPLMPTKAMPPTPNTPSLSDMSKPVKNTDTKTETGSRPPTRGKRSLYELDPAVDEEQEHKLNPGKKKLHQELFIELNNQS